MTCPIDREKVGIVERGEGVSCWSWGTKTLSSPLGDGGSECRNTAPIWGGRYEKVLEPNMSDRGLGTQT